MAERNSTFLGPSRSWRRPLARQDSGVEALSRLTGEKRKMALNKGKYFWNHNGVPHTTSIHAATMKLPETAKTMKKKKKKQQKNQKRSSSSSSSNNNNNNN